MNRYLACVCILLLAAGCGEAGPTVPILTSVAGAYSATQFTVAEVGGEPVDYLGLGASIALTLNADGSTAGRIQVPDGGEDGAFDESLLGTWTLTGTTVSSPV